MPELQLSSAKIVSTPTPAAWSQIYNAGKFFVVVTLTQETAQDDELGQLGKKLLNAIESEYFPLETKTLANIKLALKTALEQVPSPVTVSLQAASFTDDVLYVFAKGQGSIILCRQKTLGVLLKDPAELTAASGKVQGDDLFILQTHTFGQRISPHALQNAETTNPSELVEIFSPKIHEHQEATATGLFIKIQESPVPLVQDSEVIMESEEPLLPQPLPEEEILPQSSHISSTHRFARMKLPIPNLTLPRLIMLSVAIALLIILVISITATIQSKKDQQNHALFESIYPPAQKKYEEGQALISLNKNLAREDFLTAKKILDEKKSGLIPGSSEEQQVTQLLGKINAVAQDASGQQTVEPQKAAATSSPLLSLQIKTPGGLVAGEDTTLYSITSSEIKSESGKSLVKNSDTWKSTKGFGVFGGNFYVLDPKGNQLIKLVAAGSDYANSTYFGSGISPSLASATSLGIDGSIYILFSDGLIQKFTKGKPDSFSINGLDKPFSKPTQLVTSPEMDIYILDKGNNRVVVLQKNGTFSSQYVAPLLKDADAIDVQEKNKVIYILKGKDIYQIPLK